ncbi:MAG: AAA family ATPase [Gammaproteobacteria bacterium]|nr:AAA family ATPase [Gammaproteobacteria bacterium]
MSAVHSRAKAYMDYAIFNREGFVVITGEIGSGKTTLIKKLLSELDENVVVAKIFQTQLDEVELLQAILVEFGLNPFRARKVELLNMLNQFLIDSYLEGKQVLLIIDDAQNLSKRVLEEVTLLSGVETQKEKILHVILVGQPELNYMLESSDMEQLLQRVSLRYHVRALTLEESTEYVLHRLNVAGANGRIFQDNLFSKIHEFTRGVPRLINTLCDTVLTCAYASNKLLVDDEEFENAIKELQWGEYASKWTPDNKEYSLKDFNESENDFYNNIDGPQMNERIFNNGYKNINSLALVEISRQLKRIADSLEKKRK